MPDYPASAQFTATGGGGNAYRLEIIARTSAVTGGTLVEVFGQVVKFRDHGNLNTFGTGTRSWSLPGGRETSTSGPPLASGSSDWPYFFSEAGIPQTVNVYNFFNRYVPYSQGTTTRLTVSANGSGSGWLTSASAFVDVPLFTLTTISYNSNGGTAAPASQTLTPGGSFTVGAAPTRTGYTFVNWSGSNGITYTPGSSATVPSSNVTLTAVWALAAPTGLTVGTKTPNSIQLSWTAISGVAGYDLSLNGTFVTTTTATSYTFVTLTAATSYTLGVAAFTGSGSSKVVGPAATTTTSTIGNPEYAAGASYPIAKIGVPYAASVTATNATKYALAYGNLPPGLELNTDTGTIGGPEQRPQQRSGTFQNDTDTPHLDSFTFGITASGVAGSTSTTKQFVIRTFFPGERLASPTAKDFIIARRFDGVSSWVPIQRVRRFNGLTWVDITQT
jgi:uncharacterized repeat protein (TIGR02543 family)